MKKLLNFIYVFRCLYKTFEVYIKILKVIKDFQNVSIFCVAIKVSPIHVKFAVLYFITLST